MTRPGVPDGAWPLRTQRVAWGRLVAIWSVPALVSAFQSYGNMAMHGEWPQLWPFAALSLGIWYSWVPLTPPVLALARRWPVIAAPDHGSRVALWRHAGAGTAITLAHAFVWAQAALVVQRRLEPAMVARYSTAYLYGSAVLARVVTGLLTYAAVVAVGTTLESLGRLRREESRGARLAAQLAAAQVGALKMQLHPHFLFNTLHAVNVLIREDPPAAARTVTRLGDLLRLTLARAGETEVTLERELELVRLYLDIESTRFSDRLRVTYDVAPDTLDARVPDLVLQPLVENAIRHGIAPHVGAGCLAIRARRVSEHGADERLIIEVQDDGPGPVGAPAWAAPAPNAAGDHAGGVDLSTTRARLAALYGEHRAWCELREAPEGGCVARLVLPFRVEAGAGADAGGRGA